MFIANTLTDYKNCIANIPNSILKYFGVETVGDTLPDLDVHLDRKYKNVVVFVLDGFGRNIMMRDLEWRSPFQKHCISTVDSVFLSSTVPATTSFMTGLQPCEHAWLGWDNYYKDIGKNVTVFLNTEQYSTEPAADFDVAGTLTPFKSIQDRLIEKGVKAYTVSPFAEPNPDTFQKVLNRVKKLCAEPERKYIYAYWISPDDVLHEYGCEAEETVACVRNLEKKIVKFASEMQDTLLIVTADHGHIDTEISRLDDHPAIKDCLERLPSLEPRVVNFFVKKGRKRDFVREFKKVYDGRFDLLTKKEVLDRRLFGTGKEHEKFRDMLGDYIAIATDDLSIMFAEEKPWKAMHGGLSENEVKVPLIVCKEFFYLGYDADKYVREALKRLKRRYPWATMKRLDKHYSYAIEDVKGKKEFVKYYTRDNGKTDRCADGWDGELFVQEIVKDHEGHLEFMNGVKEVFDVRPHNCAELTGWSLERFEFRTHVLGSYSAFVEAGNRSAGASKTFFFKPEDMNGTFEEFLDRNKELFSGRYGLDKEYMMEFKGLKEFLGFKK